MGSGRPTARPATPALPRGVPPRREQYLQLALKLESAARAEGRDGLQVERVDIEAGGEVVRRIRSLARATFTPGVLSEIGRSAAVHDGAGAADAPVLVASADAWGRSSRWRSCRAPRHGGRGPRQSLRERHPGAGASPLFFLDYLATGRLAPDVAVSVVEGLARACRENGCALLGARRRRCPVLRRRRVRPGGFIVAWWTGDLVDGRAIVPGDVLIGLRRRAPHERVLARATNPLRAPASRHRIARGRARDDGGEALLAPHRSYLRVVQRWWRRVPSGGWPTSPAAASPTTCLAHCRPAPWPTWTAVPGRCRPSSASCRRPEACPTTTCSARSTWHRLVLVVAQAWVQDVFGRLRHAGESGAAIIGRVVPGSPPCATSEKGSRNLLDTRKGSDPLPRRG